MQTLFYYGGKAKGLLPAIEKAISATTCNDCTTPTITCANGKQHCPECWGHDIETKEPCKLCALDCNHIYNVTTSRQKKCKQCGHITNEGDIM